MGQQKTELTKEKLINFLYKIEIMSDKEVQKFVKDKFKKGNTKEEIEKELRKKGQSFYLNNLSVYPDTILFQKYKKFHHALVGLLVFTILLRLLSIPYDYGLGWTVLYLSLALGIPILLILYLRTHRKDAYLIVSALGLMDLSRSIQFDYDKSMQFFPIYFGLYIFSLIILISIIGISFFLYKKLFPKKEK